MEAPILILADPGTGTGASSLAQVGSTCNIGPAELRRRRRAAAVAGASLAAAVAVLAVGLIPAWVAPFLAPLAGATAVAVLQVRMRFCVAFGLAGVAGMGSRAGAVALDPALLTPHRRRAALMIGAAGLVTVLWALVATLLVWMPGS